jgi:hypothetical protein
VDIRFTAATAFALLAVLILLGVAGRGPAAGINRYQAA